jgi:hypothetical protein
VEAIESVIGARACGIRHAEASRDDAQTEYMPIYLRTSFEYCPVGCTEEFSRSFRGAVRRLPAHSLPSLLAWRVQARSGVGSTCGRAELGGPGAPWLR